MGSYAYYTYSVLLVTSLKIHDHTATHWMRARACMCVNKHACIPVLHAYIHTHTHSTVYMCRQVGVIVMTPLTACSPWQHPLHRCACIRTLSMYTYTEGTHMWHSTTI